MDPYEPWVYGPTGNLQYNTLSAKETIQLREKFAGKQRYSELRIITIETPNRERVDWRNTKIVKEEYLDDTLDDDALSLSFPELSHEHIQGSTWNPGLALQALCQRRLLR